MSHYKYNYDITILLKNGTYCLEFAVSLIIPDKVNTQ